VKVRINTKEMRREWILDRWYEKAFYATAAVFATFWGILFTVAFMYGFFSGLAGN